MDGDETRCWLLFEEKMVMSEWLYIFHLNSNKPFSQINFKTKLSSHGTLLDDHFLAGPLPCWGVESRHPSWSVWKSVSSHIFTIRFSDYAESSCVSIRYVCDRVSVQRGFVGDGTNLLDGQLRTWLVDVWKGRLKSFIVTECYVGTGAQASSGLLGWCGGVLWRSLRDVLIQPLEKVKMTKMTTQTHNWWMIACAPSAFIPFMP